jgi:hypothetical protein
LKLTSLINIVVFNGIALILAVLLYDDRVWRLNYWESLGFTPTTHYYPFFYVTSAVKGGTYIGGLLTIDWLQVIIVSVAVVDAFIGLGLIKQKQAQPAPNL